MKCRRLIIVLMLGLSAPGWAQSVPLHEYRLLATRGNTKDQPPELQKICDEMKYDFRTEFARQREIRQRIFDLLQSENPNADEIHYLTQKMKEVVNRIQHMAKPEWHREIWPLDLSWYIDRNDLYDEREDLAERRRIRSEPIRALTAEKIQKLREPPALRTDQLEIDGAYFSGEAHEGVSKFLINNVRMNPKGTVWVGYKKMATALELCQLLPSLQFAVTIRYTVWWGSYANLNKKFYLTYGDPLPEPRRIFKLKDWLWHDFSLLSL